MEKSKKKKVMIVVLMVILVSISCVFLVRTMTAPHYVSLYLIYIDKEKATALYVFKVFGGKPEGIEIKNCTAEDENRNRVSIAYTFKDIAPPKGVDTGDVLQVHNITNYSGWKLVVYLSGKIEGHDIEPAYAESKIPSISMEVRNERPG